VTHETGDVRQVIERLEGLAVFAEQDERAYRRAEATLMRQAAEFLKSLTPPQPAPSGWQQRIAVMDPWRTAAGACTSRIDRWCFFCGISKRTAERQNGRHDADCLWQNAVDALPPEPAQSIDGLLRELLTTMWWTGRDSHNAPNFDEASATRSRSIDLALAILGRVVALPSAPTPDAKDAIPPGPCEGATSTRSVQDDLLDAMERLSRRDDMSAEYRRDVPILIGALRLARDRAIHGPEDERPWRFCPWCGTPTGLHLGDPTQLDPLKDEITRVGHKLAKDSGEKESA
jgi:hypothetical protein